MLVRPEAVRVTASDRREAAARRGVVATTSFLGAHARVQARLADGTLVLAQMPTSQVSDLQVGDQVTVAVLPTPALATTVS